MCVFVCVRERDRKGLRDSPLLMSARIWSWGTAGDGLRRRRRRRRKPEARLKVPYSFQVWGDESNLGGQCPPKQEIYPKGLLEGGTWRCEVGFSRSKAGNESFRGKRRDQCEKRRMKRKQVRRGELLEKKNSLKNRACVRLQFSPSLPKWLAQCNRTKRVQMVGAYGPTKLEFH